MAAWREVARVLAHEIKNPLTPIQLTIQELNDKYSGRDPAFAKLLHECTDIISDEIQNLRRLAQEFSDFARMPELKPTPGNLNDLIEEIAKLYATSSLKVNLDPSLPEFELDADALRRALVNIMDNALAAAGTEGKISLTSRRLDQCAQVCICNSGPAIPADNLDKIFEPYFSSKSGGIGLGLAVVKHVVEEHGGRVTVQNVREGVEFCVELPM